MGDKDWEAIARIEGWLENLDESVTISHGHNGKNLESDDLRRVLKLALDAA